MRDFLPKSPIERAMLDATRSAVNEAIGHIERPFGIPRKVSELKTTAKLEEVIIFTSESNNIIVSLPEVGVSDIGRVLILKNASDTHIVYYRVAPGTVDGSTAQKSLASRGDIATLIVVGPNQWEII